ncbi:30S ribosomal protein S13 [Striga asiatica]|uniref:30S ribosomal protein S13 n=1 Tax=Striga asiatica TaxID=4170 RepID=A0A5A7P1H9_STRAF|nr:30S ribosomal protein S13 [Striga asiatica]
MANNSSTLYSDSQFFSIKLIQISNKFNQLIIIIIYIQLITLSTFSILAYFHMKNTHYNRTNRISMSANPANPMPSGTNCFSSVFRRMLCSGSLPTHPSDQFPETSITENHSKHNEIVKNQGTGSKPGVVAKLMGLDSFPDSPSWAHKDTSLGSFLRSRSVNSIDFLPRFDSSRLHRRVRTSVSFREGLYNCRELASSSVSNCSEKVGEIGEDEESRGGSEVREKLREKKVIRKKMEMDEGKFKRKKKRQGLNLKEKKPVMKTVGFNFEEDLLLQPKSKCLNMKQNKIMCRKEKMHSASRIYPGEIIAEVEQGEHSRRSKTARSKIPYPNKAGSHDRGTIKAIAKRKKGKKIKHKEQNCYYKTMVETICGLTEDSINENWTSMEFEDFEDVCEVLGRGILEGLLKQFVDELVRAGL